MSLKKNNKKKLHQHCRIVKWCISPWSIFDQTLSRNCLCQTPQYDTCQVMPRKDSSKQECSCCYIPQNKFFASFPSLQETFKYSPNFFLWRESKQAWFRGGHVRESHFREPLYIHLEMFLPKAEVDLSNRGGLRSFLDVARYISSQCSFTNNIRIDSPAAEGPQK
jgi:hypothetical protein